MNNVVRLLPQATGWFDFIRLFGFVGIEGFDRQSMRIGGGCQHDGGNGADQDRFGDSGAPWELVKELEVSAEHIAQKAVELMALKKK